MKASDIAIAMGRYTLFFFIKGLISAASNVMS